MSRRFKDEMPPQEHKGSEEPNYEANEKFPTPDEVRQHITAALDKFLQDIEKIKNPDLRATCLGRVDALTEKMDVDKITGDYLGL